MVDKKKPRVQKPGQKGAEFERLIGRFLSLWLTRGERDDIFRRNVLSGGQYTVSTKTGKARGRSGDMVDNHPIAQHFVARYCVECKFYRDLGLPGFLFETHSFLHTVIAKTSKQAAQEGKHWLVIAKQNQRETIILFTDSSIRLQLIADLPHHIAHLGIPGREPVYIMPLGQFLRIDPTPFLHPVERAKLL